MNIVQSAILTGHTVLFVSAAAPLLDLAGQESAGALERRLKHCTRIGYLSYNTAHADLLFQFVSMRYEKKLLVLTTNLPFKQWPTIFPGAGCTVALIDRVMHHADVIAVEGEATACARRRPPRPSAARHATRRPCEISTFSLCCQQVTSP